MSVLEKIEQLATRYRENLKNKVEQRVHEMGQDQNHHYFLYNALGVSDSEGADIDLYQNKGRFLYKYAGSFMEEAAIICLKEQFEDAATVKIENTVGDRPKKYEIDCLVNGTDAFEIKWKDATTDGDHINKEHGRMRAVSALGYKPIRLMFFMPEREQALRIQSKLRALYAEEGGEYYGGEEAWVFFEQYAKVDLRSLIRTIGLRHI